MKRFIVACVTLAGVFSWIVAAQTPATQRPELAILYTIDGFSDKAPAHVALPNFQALMAQGVYFRQNYTVQTADPSNRFPPSPWAENGYTSSVPNVVQMARSMGAPPWQQHPDGSFTNSDDLNSFGPSLTLGGYGETPLQMATGASVLAAQGTLHQPFAIVRVQRGGATIYQHADKAQQMIEGSDSYLVAVPAWHTFLTHALPVLGAEQWYSPPQGIVYAYDNYYLPGTAPTSPPVTQTSPSPSGGGRRKKKH